MLLESRLAMTKPQKMTANELLAVINKRVAPPVFDNTIMIHIEQPAELVRQKLQTEYATPWTLEMLRSSTAVVRISSGVVWRPLIAFCVVRAGDKYTITRRLMTSRFSRQIFAHSYKVFIQGVLDACAYMQRGGGDYIVEIPVTGPKPAPLVAALRGFGFRMFNGLGSVYHIHVDSYNAATPNSDTTMPHDTSTPEDEPSFSVFDDGAPVFDAK